MKQQEVFKKIGGIIKEINEGYQYLETTAEVYNDLELELMLANAHFLADHIEILRKINKHAEKVSLPPADPAPALPAAAPILPIAAAAEEKPWVPAPEPPAEAKPVNDNWFFEPVTAEEPEVESPHTVEFEIGQQGVAETEPEPAPEPVIESEPEPETIRHELTLDDIGDDWDEEEDESLPTPVPDEPAYTPTPVEVAPEPAFTPTPAYNLTPAYTPPPVYTPPVPKAEPVMPSAPVTPKPAPAEEEQVLTLNQRMSAQMAMPRMSDHLSAQPVTDLKSAITLNDKLLYIKDLFNGYSLAYSEAIDILNRLNSFDEAKSFLEGSYAAKNNWADKQLTVDKFYALLQRRYA